MQVFKTNKNLQASLLKYKIKGKTIGFVPTLGALHEGHASLVERSKRLSDITVCSIFVNPAQFNDPKDLIKYPRTLKEDKNLLEELKTDILFIPSKDEIYPADLQLEIDVDFGSLFTVMEGEHRPGHFDGVVKVVKRLLDIVCPDHLYMGQKDFQQFSLIQHMIDELEIPTQLIVCKIKREPNGLAMSSRNERLTKENREKAAIIYKTLKAVKRKAKDKDFEQLKEYAMDKLSIENFKPEYFEIVDGRTLQSVNDYEDSDYIVACAAVWAGDIRLIDNIILKKEQ
ncbi:pantoate--beta-alanine ligase [Portibacter marinus]|uniref:pantoate--beta-alanine ligase n=1 Tax=Portibacter marinus TaxID=2898660 RepID=UPI001F1E4961|nr:pantoate--beta-alanine ligase [Portibacter marinus]